jgi:hypothetical protein
VDLYRAQQSSQGDREDSSTFSAVSASNTQGLPLSPDHESSRIKKLEKLIKRRL